MINIKMNNCRIGNVNINNVAPISINNQSSFIDNMNVNMDYVGMDSKIVALDGDFHNMELKINNSITLQGDKNFCINKNIIIDIDIDDTNKSIVLYGDFKSVPGFDIISSCKLINDYNSTIGEIEVNIKKEGAEFFIGRNFSHSHISIEQPSVITIATDSLKFSVDEGLEQGTRIILDEEKNPHFQMVELKSPTYIDGGYIDISNFKGAITSGEEMLIIEKQGFERVLVNGQCQVASFVNDVRGTWQYEGFIKVGHDFISIGTINVVVE